jgi:hypothetical protein
MLIPTRGSRDEIENIEGGQAMFNASEQVISIRERALQRALKETLAQQKYTGIVPAAPDYKTIAGRARAIEQAMAAEEHDKCK